jgi:hypothetical protein
MAIETYSHCLLLHIKKCAPNRESANDKALPMNDLHGKASQLSKVLPSPATIESLAEQNPIAIRAPLILLYWRDFESPECRCGTGSTNQTYSTTKAGI